MGFGQALALLPGVSRSGMTIACARAGRVDPDKSAEFSFLMAAPLIIGGTMLEVVKSASAADGATEASASWWALAAGAAIAAVVGYFALAVLIRAVRGKWFWLFGPYCLAAGLATILLVR
jgi:undecaprenyl-diphosphatase